MPYYLPADSWYEPDCDPPSPADYGWVHEDNLPDLDHCADMLKGVIEAIYVTGNVEKLEDCLKEICSQLDLKLPAQTPVICRKSAELSNQLFNLGVALSRAQASATR